MVEESLGTPFWGSGIICIIFLIIILSLICPFFFRVCDLAQFRHWRQHSCWRLAITILTSLGQRDV